MAATLVVPEDVIRAKKCYLCEKILSVPPIMVISLEIEQYKCGRCKDVKCTTYTRNTLFENVAQFIRLPCTFNKCTEKIPWGLVEKHERECVHRTVQCPIYYQKCNDAIEAATLESHFNEKHKFNIKKCNEVWNLNTKYDYVFLIIVDDQRYLVYILHLNDLFSMGVLAIDQTTKYKKFNVKLSTVGVDEFSILYENQKIYQFDEMKHCYKCIRGCCQTKYHPYSVKNNRDDLNVGEFTNKFRKDLVTTITANEGEIKYVLNLIPDESEENRETTKTNTSNINEETLKDDKAKYDLLRKSTECPICEEYMVPPIFSCKTGHTICNLCQPRLRRCPTCEAELSNSRNFALEDLAENIKLRCHFEPHGCKFVGNTQKMYNHELECSYRSETIK